MNEDIEQVIADGTKAWACVRDAVKWQRYMRGAEIAEQEVYFCCHECRHFSLDQTEQISGRCPYQLGLFSRNSTVETCLHFEKRKEQK